MTTSTVELVRRLTARGVIQDPAWHRAVLAVPREEFVPEHIWNDVEEDGVYRAYDRDSPEVQRWLTEDVCLVTQVDDGHPAGGDQGSLPSSSLSQPSLVVAMLQALQAEDGMRILEIGTGTGYNTALLCERFGSDSVISVEVDAELADQARTTLDKLGYTPTLITGDGAQDLAAGDFDRVIATVAAHSIPPAWLAQTRPGGSIVTPWSTDFSAPVLLRLTADATGAQAHGRIVGDAGFMSLRSQRRSASEGRDHVDETDPRAIGQELHGNPRVVTDRDPGWQVVLGHLVPGLAYASYEAKGEADAGEATVYLYDQAGSWSLGEYTPAGPPYEAKTAGPRNLWAEVRAARQAWEQAGRPGRDRLGLTAGADGELTLWVDTPDRLMLGVVSGG